MLRPKQGGLALSPADYLEQQISRFRSNTTRFRSRYPSRNRRPGRAVVGYCTLDYLPPRRSTWRRFDPSSSPSATLKYKVNVCFPMVDPRIASGRDRTSKASMIRSEIL